MSYPTENGDTEDPLRDIGFEKPHDINSIWGDKLDKKDERTLRIYFQNVNGFQTNSLFENWIETYTVLNEKGVDLYGCAETNIAWNPMILSKLQYILRQKLGGGHNIIKVGASS